MFLRALIIAEINICDCEELALHWSQSFLLVLYHEFNEIKNQR